MRVLLVLLLVLAAPPARAAADCVILLHGLARGAGSMVVMEEALRAQGYTVFNSDYDSTVAKVETLAETAMPEALAACPEDAPHIHFVTHSMGGIMLRYWMAHHDVPRLGRTVMLAPPNQGSELVDELDALPPFEWLNGPAGAQLGTDGLPARLGPVWPEVGIIAGSRSLNPVYSAILPGEDDGKVSVASTKVEGMKTHLTLPATHTFLMNNPVVIGQTLSFLRTGAFRPGLDLMDVFDTLTD
ncbi:esterase/lipase family protein [Jannaschia formosa]|uniref:esterase/lipase family protein n=1 Tax=Jannaschia formosa TaxID=2259592 RepID=UPI000E1BB9EF|nr:alpha/beta hydrolase [Jannaschia formosa]TFL17619.1 alpha/beta hydrolase [Jannaschia formosa]